MKYADTLRARVVALTEERVALKAEAETIDADESRSAEDVDARIGEHLGGSDGSVQAAPAAGANVDDAHERLARGVHDERMGAC